MGLDEKGGMNDEEFFKYLLNGIVPLFMGTVADKPSKTWSSLKLTAVPVEEMLKCWRDLRTLDFICIQASQTRLASLKRLIKTMVCSSPPFDLILVRLFKIGTSWGLIQLSVSTLLVLLFLEGPALLQKEVATAMPSRKTSSKKNALRPGKSQRCAFDNEMSRK